MPDFEIEQKGVVTTINIDARGQQEVNFLLSSDRHIDNPKAKNSLAKKHLDQLKERDGLLLDFGDLFDAMQGKNDRRGSKEDIKDNLKSNNYFGAMIKDAANFFMPYRKHIALLGHGNHETAILKHNEIDLTEALIDRLNENGGKVSHGGYRGWVKIKLRKTETQRHQIFLYYSHGSGGGGPVTRGVINTNRMAVYLPDADIVVSGHIHESWQVSVPRVRIGSDNLERQDEQLHICLPTYKEEFINAGGGFHHEKGRPPKPLGASWLTLKFFKERVYFEPQRAA